MLHLNSTLKSDNSPLLVMFKITLQWLSV